MNRIIEKFFKWACYSRPDYRLHRRAHFHRRQDKRSVAGRGGGIIKQYGQELYRVWIRNGDFACRGFEVARGERGKSFVMSAINRALARLKDQSLYTDKEIIQKYKEDLAAPAKQPKSKKSVGQSEYSKEQLDSIFYDIAAADIDKAEL